MVKRKSKIAGNPKKVTADAEAWVNEAGTDPEITIPAKTDKSTESKKYPHRISFDMDKAQYKRLKYAAFDSERSMNKILREAVEEWMKARDY